MRRWPHFTSPCIDSSPVNCRELTAHNILALLGYNWQVKIVELWSILLDVLLHIYIVKWSRSSYLTYPSLCIVTRVLRTLKIYHLCGFQVCSRAVLTEVIMLYLICNRILNCCWLKSSKNVLSKLDVYRLILFAGGNNTEGKATDSRAAPGTSEMRQGAFLHCRQAPFVGQCFFSNRTCQKKALLGLVQTSSHQWAGQCCLNGGLCSAGLCCCTSLADSSAVSVGEEGLLGWQWLFPRRDSC